MSDTEQKITTPTTTTESQNVIQKEPITSDALATSTNGDGEEVDKELEAMKARVQEMESEAAKLRDMQAEVEKSMYPQEEDKETVDARSVYVGQVDYGASPEELQAHFQSCGTINRVTILCDKFTGHPKGYAYVEFAEAAFVNNAVALNESLFRGRLLKVTPKRTNVPGFSTRGRGRGRGAYRGGYAPPPYYGHSAGFGYRGRGRGRGGMYYSPY